MSGDIPLTNRLQSPDVKDASTCTSLESSSEGDNFRPTQRKGNRSRRYQRHRTRFCARRTLTLTLSVTFLMTCGTAGSLTYFYLVDYFREDLCLTERCILAASQLLSPMDQSVDPCINFYDYACGGQIKELSKYSKRTVNLATAIEDNMNNKIRVLLEGADDSTALYKIKPRAVYKLCMDTENLNFQSIQSFRQLVREVGDCSLFNPNWTQKDFRFESVLSHLSSLGISPIIQIGFLHPTALSIFTVSAGQALLPGIRLDNRFGSYYAFKSVKSYLVNSLVLMNVSQQEATKAADDVLDLKIELGLIEDQVQDSTTSKLLATNIATLNNNFTFVNWTELFESLKSGIDVSNDSTVLVSSDHLMYLEKVNAIMPRTRKSILSNYLMSFLVAKFAFALGPMFIKFLDEMYLDLKYTQPREWWENCVKQTMMIYPALVDRMYVEAYANQRDLNQIRTVATEIVQAVQSTVDENDWLSRETKTSLRAKIERIQIQVGYPEYILNDSYINNLSETSFTSEGQFLDIVIDFHRYKSKQTVKKSNLPFATRSWIVPVTKAGAYWNLFSNSIEIPLGFLQTPTYSPKYLRSMVFGAIGSIIGHELVHGLDADPMFNVTWKEEELRKLTHLSECFKDQYRKFSYKGEKLDGASSLAENMCDLDGLKLSYKAFQSSAQSQRSDEKKLPGINMNHNQIFFLSFAQTWCSHMSDVDRIYTLNGVHAPDRFRVLGTLQNSQDFADTFQCIPGSPMNPLKKCAVY